MTLDILCTPNFNREESDAIDQAAEALHLSREEVVRSAVKFFAAQCVPTQGAIALPGNGFFIGVCVPTQKVHV